MTCIVGVIDKKNKKVVIGADSAGVCNLDITHRKDVKVFKVGDFVIGCTSSFRMIQLLRFSFTPPTYHPDVDLYEYMCTSFINAIRKCFREGGFTEIESSVERGGVFLVGYKDRLFEIEGDFQVGESYEDFSSVGCGGKYALGALSAIGESLSPEERVKKALEVATHLSGGVRPPYVLETT
jgi:ATP-dependent protease HslVU (ClpYQ) peptidase subunit